MLQVVLRYEEDYARTGNATYKDFHVAFYDLPGSQGYAGVAVAQRSWAPSFNTRASLRHTSSHGAPPFAASAA